MESNNRSTSAQNPGPFVRSTMDGVKRVQDSKGLYAFLMESSTIEFFIERKCDLTQVGGMIDSKGYGIAMKPGTHIWDKNVTLLIVLELNCHEIINSV